MLSMVRIVLISIKYSSLVILLLLEYYSKDQFKHHTFTICSLNFHIHCQFRATFCIALIFFLNEK